MKNIFLIIAIAVFAFSCKTEDKGYVITTTVNNVKDGTKVWLKTNNNRKITVVDSTTVQNGEFIFKGIHSEPNIFGIFIDSIKSGIYPFVGVSDKISIEAYKDSLHLSKITGSLLNDELMMMRNKRDAIEAEGKPFMDAFIKARDAKDTKKMDAIKKQMGVIRDKSVNNDWEFVKTHPNSFLAPMVFEGIMANPKYKDSIKMVFDNFSDKIKQSKLAKKSREYLVFMGNKKAPTSK